MAEDPRTIITPTAFTVAPELLGYVLATPTRRLAAIGIDAALAAIIAGTSVAFLVAAAAALFAWRAIGGPTERLLAGRGRLLFRGAMAVLALIIVINVWNAAADRVRSFGSEPEPPAGAPPPAAEPGQPGQAEPAAPEQAEPAAPGDPEAGEPNGNVGVAFEDLELSGPEKAAFLMRLAALEMASGEAAAGRAADLGGWVLEHVPEGTQRDRLSAGLAEGMEPEARTVFNRMLGRDTADTAVAAVAAPRDTLGVLAAENARLEATNRELSQALAEVNERAEPGGVRAFMAGISDDLGLGIGWFALYFTAFTVLGRGQTPGKRLLGIKVLRLDNRPLGWWLSFERFGGYAASFSTGLLGFAQILWDRNRQALHDKAVGTVVIRLRDGQPIRQA